MHTAALIASAAVVIARINTSETLTLAPHIPSAGVHPPISMRARHLSSASTEVATDPAPAMSASTPPMAPPEAVLTSQATAGLSPSAAVSPMQM